MDASVLPTGFACSKAWAFAAGFADLADVGWLLFGGGSTWLRCWLFFHLDVPLHHDNELLPPMVVRMRVASRFWMAFATVCYIRCKLPEPQILML